MTAPAAPAPVKELTLEGVFKPGTNTSQSFGLCIYGRGGVGKTTLLATMPGRGLIIDVPQIEGGTFVLAGSNNIDVKSVEEWDEVNDIYWFLEKKAHPYRWVAVDSITAFLELAKRKTIKERDLNMDPHVISLQEWGKVGRLVGELVYRFRRLKTHTIWIAQERKFGNEEDPATPSIIGPDVSPSALQMLLPSMLLVARLSVERGPDGGWERHLRIGPHNHYYTKCRARPNLDVPAVIRNPRLDVLLKYLLGSGERPEQAEEASVLVLQ